MTFAVSNTLQDNNQLDLLRLFEETMHFWRALRNDISQHIHKHEDLLDQAGKPVANVSKYVQLQLLEYIQDQQQNVQQFASASQQDLYTKQLYAVAAIIDEQILEQLHWGHEIETQWLESMLELRLFKSRNSGAKLIDEMELLAARSHNFSQYEKQLAMVYVRVIWMGFDGKYSSQAQQLARLQRALLQSAEVNLIQVEKEPLFHACYQHNINPQEQFRLAPISQWKRYFVRALWLYLLTGVLIWFWFTSKLNAELTRQIEHPTRIAQLKSGKAA